MDELEFRLADRADAPTLAALHAGAAAALTHRFGEGRWSKAPSERAVAASFGQAQLWLAHRAGEPAATFRLSTRKPWAIDPAYFTPARRPLYLTDLAVDPGEQGRGVGRRCMAEVDRIAAEWPADAVWLDAFDADAGAGGFYLACGYREVGRAVYRGNPLVYFEKRIEPHGELGGPAPQRARRP